MVRLVRSFFFGRWLRVQGGDVSLIPLLILLAVALAISYFGREKANVTPLPGPISFAECGNGLRMNCVVDGDTIWATGEKIRLADIDAPEVFSPGCDWERVLGERATHRLTELLNEGVTCKRETRDELADDPERRRRSCPARLHFSRIYD